MQAEMLDSTISRNHQELSSVEYVDSHENPIATIPRDDASVQDVEDPRSLQLIFGQRHHDIDCALCPTAKRACNRAWFSAKQVENWSEMSKMTLWRWLERLEKAHRISTVSDMVQWSIPHAQGGSTPTTLYNLNVLNQLAMVCIDDEIILGNFKGNESLPLANRGNTFVSLRGVLEILSKTELSSEIVDNFQDEVFGSGIL